MAQGLLFSNLPPAKGEAGEEASAARFLAWVERNPLFLRVFMRIALERARAGRPCSARHIFDLIRWEPEMRGVSLDDGSGSPWRIPNDTSPWFARMFHALYPEHEGFFEVRPAKADVDFYSVAHRHQQAAE